MTDLDRIDRWAHKAAHRYTKTCLGWATLSAGHAPQTEQCRELETVIHAAIIEAWNAALDEAAIISRRHYDAEYKILDKKLPTEGE